MVRALVDITLGQGSLATYRTSMGMRQRFSRQGSETSRRIVPGDATVRAG